eukprot:13855184-Alexandrium_andersonii.AAC.1
MVPRSLPCAWPSECICLLGLLLLRNHAQTNGVQRSPCADTWVPNDPDSQQPAFCGAAKPARAQHASLSAVQRRALPPRWGASTKLPAWSS